METTEKVQANGVAPDHVSDRRPVSIKEMHDSIVDQIRREDDLVNSRLHWLLQSEMLLVAAMGLTLTGIGLVSESSPNSDLTTLVARTLFAVMPLVGIAIAIYSRRAIERACNQLADLKAEWLAWARLTWGHDLEDVTPSERALRGVLPRPFARQDGPGGPSTQVAKLLPMTLALIWTILLVAEAAWYLFS